MSSASQKGRRSRNRGRRFEQELARRLRPIWPTISRATTGRDQPDGDFRGCPWYIEAKHTQTARIPEWLAKIEREAGDRPRMLVFALQRTKAPRDTYAVVPLDLLIRLLEDARGR